MTYLLTPKRASALASESACAAIAALPSSVRVGSTISVPATGHDMVGAWYP